MRRNVFLGLLALVTVALVGFACGGKEEKAAAPAPAAKAAPAAPAPAAPAPAPKEEAKAMIEDGGELGIGIMTIATGAGAAYGLPYQTGKLIAFDEINAQGGLVVGNKKYHLKADVEDSRYEIPVMLSIIEKWVNQDKLKFVYTNGDPMIGLVNPKSTPAKMVHLSSTWDMQPLHSPYTFGYLSTQDETASILFKILQEREPQAKSVMYVPVNFRFDINAAAWTKEWAAKMGFNYLGEAFVEGDQIDMTPTANAALAKKPDIIITGCIGGNTAPMIRALRDGGFKGILATNWACTSLEELLYSAFKSEPRYVENYYGVESTNYPVDPDLSALWAKYHDYVPTAAATAPLSLDHYYYGGLILTEALKQAGTIDDPDKIAKTIENISLKNKFFPGDPSMSFGGTIKLGQKHEFQPWHTVNLIKNGKIETLQVVQALVP